MSINTQRFDWKGATREECAVELLRRNIRRYTTKASMLPCYICGAKHIMHHNFVYYPAVGLSKDNQVVGHADCVEKVALGEKGRISTADGAAKRHDRSIILAASANRPFDGDVAAQLKHLQGWQDGVKYFLTGEDQGVKEDVHYLQGWREGLKYARENAGR